MTLYDVATSYQPRNSVETTLNVCWVKSWNYNSSRVKCKVSFIGKILKVLRSLVFSLLSTEEELLTLISNTILIFIANTPLVP